MKKTITLAILVVAFAMTITLGAETAVRTNAAGFASEFQTIPIVASTPGVNGAIFQSYVAILNPTSTAFAVTATFYDANGSKTERMINLAAGEMKTYQNFLREVFNMEGAGSVTLRSTSVFGNNRFIVTSEARTVGTAYSTTVPALEFAGSNSRSFAAGISINSENRTNVGCYNQSAADNTVKVRVLDKSGQQTLGSFDLQLAPNGWRQAPVSTVVADGVITFEPTEAAVCYAVVVNNTTHDGRFISSVEYTP
jgi:hypothetical protein